MFKAFRGRFWIEVYGCGWVGRLLSFKAYGLEGCMLWTCVADFVDQQILLAVTVAIPIVSLQFLLSV